MQKINYTHQFWLSSFHYVVFFLITLIFTKMYRVFESAVVQGKPSLAPLHLYNTLAVPCFYCTPKGAAFVLLTFKNLFSPKNITVISKYRRMKTTEPNLMLVVSFSSALNKLFKGFMTCKCMLTSAYLY